MRYCYFSIFYLNAHSKSDLLLFLNEDKREHFISDVICGIDYPNGSQSLVPKPVAPASLGSMLGMQILRPYHRPTASETLRVGPVICALTSLVDDSDAL